MKAKGIIQLIGLLLLTILLCPVANTQEFNQDLPDFTKIIVGERINLVILQDEDKHHIHGTVENIELDNLNIKVKNNTLEIYLDNARYWGKNKVVKDNGYKRRISNYDNNVKVTVYVTCEILNKLVIKGEQIIICEKPIDTEKFKLTAYGEPVINVHSLKTNKLKLRLYGESKVTIENSIIKSQSFKLYGENEIDIRNTENEITKIVSFGENELLLPQKHKLIINSIGESKFYCNANSDIKRRLIIGDNRIEKYNDFGYVRN